jgi:ribosomal protein S13
MLGGKHMTQNAYSKQDLINIIHHLQAKVSFYKHQYEELKLQEITNEELNEKLKIAANHHLDLTNENKQLKEELERLQNLENQDTDRIQDSLFLKGQRSSQQGKRINQLQADTSNLDPWFVKNLKERKSYGNA